MNKYTTKHLDSDVNLITVNFRGMKKVRETDGRYTQTNFGAEYQRKEAQRLAENERQFAEYGDILFA